MSPGEEKLKEADGCVSRRHMRRRADQSAGRSEVKRKGEAMAGAAEARVPCCCC